MGYISAIQKYCNTSSTNCKNAAVALAGPSAALVLFQRHQPNVPPHKMVNSAASAVPPALQFGGLSAQIARLVQKDFCEEKHLHRCVG